MIFTRNSLDGCSRSSETLKCMFQQQIFLWKLQLISGFDLIVPFFSLPTNNIHISSFSYFSIIFCDILQRETDQRAFPIGILLLYKRRRLHLSHLEKIILNSLYFLLSACSIIQYWCFCFLVSCLSNQLSQPRVLDRKLNIDKYQSIVLIRNCSYCLH